MESIDTRKLVDSAVARPDDEGSGGGTCWMCCGALCSTSDQPTFELPTTPLFTARRPVCDRCFAACYRDLFLPRVLAMSDPYGGGPIEGIGPECSSSHTLAELGRHLAEAIHSTEGSVESAALSSAAKCGRCDAICAVPRNGADGLPDSVCIDGRPHVLWRCTFCWREHTCGGATCEQCGRSDGAHRYQCPWCLRCGVFKGPAAAKNGHGPHDDSALVAEPNMAVAAEEGGGPGGHCGRCDRQYKALIHDCGRIIGSSPDVLAGLEFMLGDIFADSGLTLRDCASRTSRQDATLFHSLAECLLGDAAEWPIVRRLVVGHLSDNRELYQYYFAVLITNKGGLWSETTTRKAAYTPRLSKEGRKKLKAKATAAFSGYLAALCDGTNPGDELCLQAAARYFNTIIHIVTSSAARWHIVFAGTAPQPPDNAVAAVAAAAATVTRTPRQAAVALLPTPRGRGTADRALCFVRRWAPMAFPEEGEQGKEGHGSGGAGKAAPAVRLLVDERLGGRAAAALLAQPRLRLFFSRDTPADPLFSCQCANGPLMPPLPAILAAVAAGIDESAETVRTAAAIRQRLEAPPEAPKRPPPAVTAAPVARLPGAPPLRPPTLRTKVNRSPDGSPTGPAPKVPTWRGPSLNGSRSKVVPTASPPPQPPAQPTRRPPQAPPRLPVRRPAE